MRLQDLTADNAPELQHEKYILVYLKNLNISRLLSRDRLKGKRQGLLGLNFGAQASTLSWEAEKEKRGGEILNPEKLSNQLLYFGYNNSLLEIEAQLIEVDKQAKGKDKNEMIMSSVAKSALLVPNIGTILSSGLEAFKSLFKFVHRRDNDTEINFQGALANVAKAGVPKLPNLHPLKSGRYSIDRVGEDGEQQVSIEFEVLEANPVKAGDPREKHKFPRMLVMLEELQIAPTGRNKNDIFKFDSSFGFGRQAKSESFQIDLDDGKLDGENVLGVQYKILYAGDWHFGTPFRISMAFIKQKDVGLFQNVLKSSSDLISQFADDREERDMYRNMGKAGQSFTSFAFEFLPNTQHIGVQSGILLGEDNVKGTTLEAAHMNRALGNGLHILNESDEWQDIAMTFTNEDAGNVHLKLKVKKLRHPSDTSQSGIIA